ncbi:MAG: hypothetical protein ACR2J7_10380 [Luteimonas sp.]
MNKSLRMVLLSLLVTGLAACASSMDRDRYASDESSRMQNLRIEPDATYINAVDRTARRRGVQVEWINPPIRRIPNQ